jgi:dTDP-4-amino-4,6-dideoxygalactose transaminase
MRKEFLSFAPPCLSDLEINEVVATLKDGNWLSSGPKTKLFEQEFQAKVGAPAALALNSATAGLHLSMLAHDIGPGDEVITTPMTFCASANVIEHVGGSVVFADIEPDTLLIDTREIEKRITKNTKMILPVHYCGQPADMKKINSLASNAGAAVVEDAAHCMPSKIGEEWIGASKNLTAFSFYANKNMTTGEGGMLTGEEGLISKARTLALHGMSRNAWNRFAKGGTWRYDVPEPGFKYNMTDILASIGLVQLRRLDELYERRMKLVNYYLEAFKDHKFVKHLRVKPGNQCSWHLFIIQLELDRLKIDRDRFFNELQEANIGCSVHYTPVHMLSYYANKYGLKPESFPNAKAVFERMISIPLSSKLTVEDARDVVDAVNDICKRHAR